MTRQLEFPLITKHFPAGSVRLATRPKAQKPIQEGNPDPLLLVAALTAENISFFSFALIVALQRHKTPMPLASLARSVGHSYWAVRSQVVNTHYFRFGNPNPLVTAELTPDAETKLLRIEKLLSN